MPPSRRTACWTTPTVVGGDTLSTETGPISVPQGTLGPSVVDTGFQVDTTGQADTAG